MIMAVMTLFLPGNVHYFRYVAAWVGGWNGMIPTLLEFPSTILCQTQGL